MIRLAPSPGARHGRWGTYIRAHASWLSLHSSFYGRSQLGTVLALIWSAVVVSSACGGWPDQGERTMVSGSEKKRWNRVEFFFHCSDPELLWSLTSNWTQELPCQWRGWIGHGRGEEHAPCCNTYVFNHTAGIPMSMANNWQIQGQLA